MNTYSLKNKSYWEKILSLYGVSLIYSLISTTALAAPEGDKITAEVPTAQVYDTQPLDEVLNKLQNSFKGNYLKRYANNSYELHQTSKVKLSTEKDTQGKEQPIIILEDHGYVEKLYFNQIKKVNDATLNDETGISYHVLFTYNNYRVNSQGLPVRELLSYDLPVSDNPDIAASYVLALSKSYTSKSSTCPKFPIVPEKIENVKLTTLQLESICINGTSNLPKDYELKSLGQVDYDPCVYDPQKISQGLEEVVTKVHYIVNSDPKEGILVFCGNADTLSAERCSLPNKEGNFLLSFNRARELANYVSDKENLTEFTQIPYPNGTMLNERSTKVYSINMKRKVLAK